MIKLNQLTASANQSYTVTNDEGYTFRLNLRYLATQEAWVFDIRYENIELNNFLLPASINCLRSMINRLPFSLMCLSTDGGDPQNIEDFITGRIQVYVLNKADIEEIELTYFTNPQA